MARFIQRLQILYNMKDDSQDFEQPKKPDNDESKPKNMKNVYIQKLTKLFGLSKESLNEVEGTKANEGDIPVAQPMKRQVKSLMNIGGRQGKQLNDKVEKNRESARKARKRKKLYVQLLQKKVEKYKDIAQEGKQLQKDVQRFMSELRTYITKKKQLSALKPVIMNNITNVVSFSTQFNETDVSALLTNYQMKFGPSSSERFQSMDSSIKQIKQIFLPNHITSIINSDSQKLVKQMQKNNSDPNFDMKETRNIKQHIDKECEKLHHSLNVLKLTIDMAKDELRQINKTIDNMKNQQGGSQTCRFLMMVEEQSAKPSNIRQFKQFLDQLNFDTVRQNNQERHQFIFKDDLKKNILIRGKPSQQLMRRINLYLDREII